MVKQVGEIPKRKLNSPRIFKPSKSDIGDDIIFRFNAHLDQLLRLISGCAGVDLEKTIISSPVTKLITYNLKNAITLLTGHLHRHINQAIRVKQAKEFPPD